MAEEVKHTPGPWRLIIDDTGGQWSGWPLCIDSIDDEDKTVVRTGGQWPYEWDRAISQREAVANAQLIASAPELLDALRRSAEGWANALELGLIPPQHKTAATILRDEAWTAIAKATGAPQ